MTRQEIERRPLESKAEALTLIRYHAGKSGCKKSILYPVFTSLFCLSYSFAYLLYFCSSWDRSYI